VKNITKDIILPHQRGEILTVHPHACGENQPSTHVEMTRHHAIRCPKMMSNMRIPDKMQPFLHVYPYNLPPEVISFESDPSNTHLCNVDVGDTETPLVVEGMLAESWDGIPANEIRMHTWQSYNETVMMKRMRVIRIQM
jgi:hypothetical protein